MAGGKQPKYYQAQVRDVQFGQGVAVVEPCNLYECQLDDKVFVGPFVEIQKGVQIGARTRIQSHSFICELVTIGTDCFIGHGVMFINDLLEDGFAESKPSKWKRTDIEDHVTIGSNATILPVRICTGTIIGAGAVVTKDITTKGVYVGNPARLVRRL
jgi:acetyltransferase-like isoleucine patch superfamily enzyme